MKKFILLTGTAILLFMTAGCRQDEDMNSSSTAKINNAKAETTEADPPEKDKQHWKAETQDPPEKDKQHWVVAEKSANQDATLQDPPEKDRQHWRINSPEKLEAKPRRQPSEDRQHW
ncbi:hypothetical protein BAX94_03625 [Elizabethkingia meningoseptica]|uniref:Lipoprotein n=1 Tax=Elizabethkingia meningoseptica TaxID=238 RepID=A0A1V3TZJ9_ELIME|nr:MULTISPECIES: hypothetical protein [Elizabethkingia]AQX06601.1 hypothetical protein BBD33_15665 [Elizabethkingia meningoseptica]AQX14135.1 hypothetical protein BBD35_17975 [Elizabethkingia meningoseptica]AQX48648.1 hypothetical protein B5G46_15660 [Elizabethkingia meningoseptica]EJK5328216.1 hypothetical protein [Elizabethkingia meningoseptica]EOR28528.1 hypothetical protein L100_15820 [Elizabethkingia meningoseptica ATCC 13253 = NBRC 12535]